MARGQLRLLLWKDYLIRKRQFITLAGVIWAAGIILAFYVVRENIDNHDFPTCQFPARALPSAGMLPFLQSFMCSVSNECSPMDQFEEIPAYENAKFTQMQRKFTPLLNESVLDLASTTPDAVRLLSTLATVADDEDFKDFAKNGLKVKDLFSNPLRVKRYVTSHLQLNNDVAQSLMTSDISFQGLLKGDLDRCSPQSLSQTLIMRNSEHMNAISDKLCSMDNKDMQKIFMDLMYEINFNKYIKMLGNMYYKLSGDDRISQLGKFLTALLRMTKLEHFFPPEITSLLLGKQTDFSYLNLNMIKKFLELFEPTFGDTKEYQSIKEFTDIAVTGVQYMDKIFGNPSNNETTEDITGLVVNDVAYKLDLNEGFNKINKVLSNAANAFDDIKDEESNIDPYNVLTQLTKLIYKFLSKQTQHDVLFYSTLISKLMESANQVININMHIQEIAYNVSLRNPKAMEVIKNLPPIIVGKGFEALVSPQRTQIMTSKLNFPGQMFCDLSKLQDFFLIGKSEAATIKTHFCTDAWKNYVSDLIGSFGVFNVRSNINDMASLLIQETMGKDTSSQLYSIEKDFEILQNFTSALVTMDAEKQPSFDWKKLLGVEEDSKIMKVINEKAHLGKLMLISVHGALAKEIVKQNAILQYKITPILLDATTLVTALNDQLETTPANVPEGLKNNYENILKTLLLTALNEKKTYLSLSTFCDDIFCHGAENTAKYLEVPTGVDIELLSSALCDASAAIEKGLRNDSVVSKAIMKITNTTHTLLEEVNWTRLISGIQKLYTKLDRDYPYVFEFSTYAMDNESKELVQKLFRDGKNYWFSLRHLQRGLHLSVKLGFRLLDLLDHGIFNMTNVPWMKMNFVVSSSIGPLKVVDDALKLFTALLSNTSHSSDMPLTTVETVSSIIPNLPQLIIDSVNVMVNDKTDIEPIISLMNMEPAWPCSTGSLSELLELTDTSQDAVKALERLLCMEADMLDEWTVYLEEKKAKINKSLSWNNTTFEPHLFLKFSSTFDDLLDDTVLVKDAMQYVLNDDSTKDHIGLKSAWDYAMEVMNTTKRNDILKRFLHKLDSVLNTIATPSIPTNISMSSVWERFISCNNGSNYGVDCRVAGRATWQYTLKTMSVVFDAVAVDLSTYFTEVNEPNSNLLQVLGFTKSTALYMLYDRLSEFVSVLVNSYWDFGFMSQIRRASQTQFWDCEAVVSALVPAPESSIHQSDIDRVKPYLCPSFIYWISLPKGDNVLFNLVAKPQYYIFSMPVQNATSKFEVAFTKATDIADYLTNISKENKTGIADELNYENIKDKLANFVDNILNYKLNETNPAYIEFTDVTRKQVISKIYLTRIVAIINKLGAAINNITIEEMEINDEEMVKLKADMKIIKSIFKRKAIDLIAMNYDILTDILWTNDNNYTLVDAMDDMCSKLKDDDKSKTILVDEERTKLQICAKNYKLIFGQVQGEIEADYEDTRQSLLNFVEVLQSEGNDNVTDVFEFLNSRNQQIEHLKHSIKYSYDLGLPLYLKYLQSNLQSYNVVLTFISGGDWWQNFRDLYNGPYAQKFFSIMESSFEIADDLLNNLDGIHLIRLIHEIDLNDTASFCRPNITLDDYFPDSTRALTDLKHQICSTDLVELFREIPPLLYVSQGYESELRVSKDIEYSMVDGDISTTRSKLALIREGPSIPVIPPWVTDEKVVKFRRNVMGLMSKETLTKLAFGVLSNAVDAGTLFLNNNQCDPCSQMTTWFKQLNLQLFKKQEYDNLLCQLHTMTLEDVYHHLKNDFHWDMFVTELISVRNYTKYELNKSLNEFLSLVKGHFFEELSASTTKLTECLAKNITRNQFGNASLFLSILSRTTKLLQAEAPHLNEIEGVKDLPYLNQLFTDIAHNLDVLRPLKTFMKNGTDAWVNGPLMNAIGDHEVALDVEDSIVNLRVARSAMNLEELLHLLTNSWEHICEDHDCSAIYTVVQDNLNITKVEQNLPSLQASEFWRFSFIRSMLQRMERVTSHVGRLAGAGSGLDVMEALKGGEPLINMVIRILGDDTFDSIVYSLQGLIEEVRPLLKGAPLDSDLKAIVSGLNIFHQFKTYLLDEEDLKLQVSTLFPNPEGVETGLSALGINNTNFWSIAAPRIHAGYIQLKPVLSSKDPDFKISTLVCNMDAMSSVLAPGSLDVVTAEDVLAATTEQFCRLKNVGEVAMVLLQNMDIQIVMEKLKDLLLTKLYAASELTPEQGSEVIARFPRMASLLPLMRDNLGDVMDTFSQEPLFQSLANFSSVGGLMGSSEFLVNAGNMVCGKPFQTGTSRIIKKIISTKELSTKADQAQLDVLPTEFCRSMYQDIIGMEGGKIVWSFVKPLIMGRILYTPPHPAVQRIVEQANSSFASMVQMANLVHSFSSAFPSLESMSSHREGLLALQQLVTSPGMEGIQEVLLGDAQGVGDVDVEGMFEKVGDLKGIGALLSKASSLLECINLNRFQPVNDEHDLMVEAARLMAVNEFSAGVVFLNVDRLNESLEHVEYKIRMDIENAPTTARLKPYLWTPGPEGSFIENMRYFRGFIQIQDLLDKAIIQLSATRSKRELMEPDWAVYTQQEPYPCYRKDYFQSSLHESQALIVAFFFSLLFTVASVVRFNVAEKESGNTMLLSVMGVDLRYHTLSWLTASLLEMTVTVAVVAGILHWCSILPGTDPLLLFTLLFLFGIAVLSFCYLMSKLFKSASFGGVCSGIAYMVTFMPFVMILSLETVLSHSSIMLICLSMSSSMCYAFLYISRLEALGSGAQWAHLWSSDSNHSIISFAAGMLIVDAVIYAAVGYCIDRYFGIKSIQNSITINTSGSEKSGVSIVAVSKTYGARTRRAKVALDNVSIELQKGQITSLLGHNGAGKTTLINILTGMARPTSGNVIIRCNNGARLGVCPQHDVLYPCLTAREHVQLYARLRGANERERDRMLQVLSLEGVCEQPVCSLSGGTRRRLCVALAFVGQPSLVVLDEPTAGVDPAARREIWSMIVQLKEERTILLTTHHLDEAELLSDQIVILHRGQIHTTGSPIEIKRTLGSGYKLTVNLQDHGEGDDEEHTETVLDLVRGVVNNASVLQVGGGRVEIGLPFYALDGANNDFQRVCDVLEDHQKTAGFRSYAMDCSSLEQVFFDICQRADSEHDDYAEEVPSKSASSSSVQSERALVPAEGPRRGQRSAQFLALLRARVLHHMRNRYLLFMLVILPSLFVTIAMSFSTIRPPADNEVALRLDSLYTPSTQYLITNPSTHSAGLDPTFAQRVMNQLKVDKKYRNWKTKDTPQCECTETRQECKIEGNATAARPEMMVLPDVDTLNTWLVSSIDVYMEDRYGGFTSTLKNNKTNLIAWYNNKGYHAMPSFVNALNNAILRTVGGTHRQITAYSHPLKISKEQMSKETVYQHIADAGISSLVVVAFSLASAGGAVCLVASRRRQEMRLHQLCGVSPALLCATALAWDVMIITVNMVITATVMWLFGFPVFVARHNLPAICILFVLYGFACASLVHCLCRMFSEASLANMVLFCGNTFLGLAGLTALLILDLISESDATDNARWMLHKLFMLSPPFALGDGMLEIARNTIQAQVLNRFGMDTYNDPLTSDLVALHYAYLVVVGIALTLLNYCLECGHFTWIFDRCISAKTYAALGERTTAEPADVAAERRRAMQAVAEAARPPLTVATIGNINRGFVHTEGKHNSLQRAASTLAPAACADLGKAYGDRIAVRALYLTIPAHQCTALLGENGAGKSSTFAMLCGELRPSRGTVRLHGGVRRGLVSYCPQNDALDPLLTVTETLDLYCRLRGIAERKHVIERTLDMFELKKYASTRAGALSGGNKRKLCTAVALMGRTPLVLLDEPTSGMDPISRGVVARGVCRARAAGRAVLLSTHALEDARTLASRVALLRAGELACAADTDECITRFGGGYVVQCRTTDGRIAWSRASSRMPHATLHMMHQHSVHFVLPTIHTVEGKPACTRVSDIFRLMTALQAAGVVDDYTINQTSLEQMFLTASKKENIEESDTPDGNLDSVTSL